MTSLSGVIKAKELYVFFSLVLRVYTFFQAAEFGAPQWAELKSISLGSRGESKEGRSNQGSSQGDWYTETMLSKV